MSNVYELNQESFVLNDKSEFTSQDSSTKKLSEVLDDIKFRICIICKIIVVVMEILVIGVMPPV